MPPACKPWRPCKPLQPAPPRPDKALRASCRSPGLSRQVCFPLAGKELWSEERVNARGFAGDAWVLLRFLSACVRRQDGCAPVTKVSIRKSLREGMAKL